MLVQDITYYLTAFGMDLLRSVIILFVVRDPIDTIPLFITITKKKTKKDRNGISKTAVITTGALLIIFAIAETQILSFWNYNSELYDCRRDIIVHNISGITYSWILEIWWGYI